MTAFRLPEPGSPEIRVENDLLRGPRVLADGAPVARRRSGLRPMWPIPMPDGSTRELLLAGQFIGLEAIVGDRIYPIERRLAPWELILAVVPIGLLTLLVGVAGILAGGVVTGLSFPLFHREWPAAARVGAWLGLTALAGAAGLALSQALV